jgi:hypothetical protein
VEPFQLHIPTPYRADKHAWLKVHMTPSKLPQLKRRGKQCAETGDGHYLNRYHSDCVVKLSLDKFDPKAQLALDLNELPQRAGKAAQYYGTLDLVVCHDVFEHLEGCLPDHIVGAASVATPPRSPTLESSTPAGHLLCGVGAWRLTQSHDWSARPNESRWTWEVGEE